jgi:SulP family sulfate permease
MGRAHYGEIPSGIPNLQIDPIQHYTTRSIHLNSRVCRRVAVLGSIDSLLTSVIADNMTKTRHNSNRELIGQGIGNMLAAALGNPQEQRKVP